MSSMIKAENLKYEYIKTFDNDEVTHTEVIKALDDVSVTIEKGSFVAVLGHNGSGKSTFAKLINGLTSPTGGSLWVNGYDTKNEEFIWDIRKSAGMVFQNPDNQIVATVVEEDVAFGPENLGVKPETIRERVADVLKTVRMTAFRKHSPAKLSGGQKQRIAIAGVLAMQPECIVLDEPTAMLDPEGRKDVIETVKKLNKEQGITIVLITHYMNETVDADKVIVIDDGKFVMSGTPKEIFVQVDRLKGYGLDVPQVTETAHELRKMGIDIPADILTTEEMVNAICQLKSSI
ncbi:MAG: energy-coupling factor transporter ATPase [Firmicutes bacterium]|nr:energy-coupling factor transporter ATPase [Bacillota bacterium]